MEPFAEFLIAMGYPAERLRNPRDGALRYCSYADSRELAGTLAWHYERDGMMPMLIGHSQGGMLRDRGAARARRRVRRRDRRSGTRCAAIAEPRTTIVDPRTGEERPVVGPAPAVRCALATGRLMRVLLGQWAMLAALAQRAGHGAASSPASSSPGTRSRAPCPNAARDDPYRASGDARVRNVMLPASYGHICAAADAASAPSRDHARGSTRSARACRPPRRRTFPASTAQHRARGRHLVQHQEALVPGGAAIARAAAPRADDTGP